MTRIARNLLFALFFVLLAGCGGSSPPPPAAPTAPLLGAYREAGGGVVEFLSDGRYITSGAMGGRFSVDGDRVTLTSNNGKVVVAKRLGDDVVQIDGDKGPLKLFRVGSAAAQTAEATTLPPPAPEPEQPKLPQPDRSVPLSSYVLLENPDIALLPAAFADTPLGDEQKLALLYQEAPADAFARKDWIAQHLPAVNARIAELAKSRYIRFKASSWLANGIGRKDPGYAIAWNLSYESPDHARLQPYDLATRSFGIPCLNKTGLFNGRGQSVRFDFGAPERGCALPVPDEATARKIEASRVARNAFVLRADVYAFLAGAGPGGTEITPIRFDVTVLDPTDTSNRTVLATVPVEL